MQVQSILGRNGFPGSPLFCQYGTRGPPRFLDLPPAMHYGLVGIITNQDSGSNAGDKTKLKTMF